MVRVSGLIEHIRQSRLTFRSSVGRVWYSETSGESSRRMAYFVISVYDTSYQIDSKGQLTSTHLNACRNCP